jgi:hypothetical protein
MRAKASVREKLTWPKSLKNYPRTFPDVYLKGILGIMTMCSVAADIHDNVQQW